MTDKNRILFIDRDGTLIIEPPVDYQVDTLDKLEFYPGVFRNMHLIKNKLDFKLVIVSNQDGLGTTTYSRESYEMVQSKMLKAFENEGVTFDAIHIDCSMPEDNAPTRKPKTGLLTEYFSDEYDLKGSYVIGDRMTDLILAKNMGCSAILLQKPNEQLFGKIEAEDLEGTCALITDDWDKISEFLFSSERRASIERKTKETEIVVEVNLDGNGKTEIETGLAFFDHMLEQIGKHSGIDLKIKTKGDLKVDEHHTVEDTAIVLGEALKKSLGDKRGTERYGFCLPMDDCLCSVALDFGGRPWLVWDAEFKRERVGDVPTELFLHFFKSLSDSAKMNLNIKAVGENEHHKIEGIFKAFAKSIKMAIKRDIYKYDLPSTKGVL